MTESDFFLQLSLSKANNPKVLYNFDGLNEVANCIVAIANNNPSAKFIIQGCELDCSHIRDKVKDRILNPDSVMKEIIILSGSGYVKFAPMNGSITGSCYGQIGQDSIFGGFYIAFAKDNDEIHMAREKAMIRCKNESASAIIIVR